MERVPGAESRPAALPAVVLWVLVVGYLALYGYGQIKGVSALNPDGMNYIDVARNVMSGRGISQSTLGFNQPRFFPDSQIPTPLTSQPPLYPLTIALLGASGLPLTAAALLVSIISFGCILALGYLLGRQLYDERTAYLAVGCLLLYYPLRLLVGDVVSEPLGMAIALLSLWLLVKLCRSTPSRTFLAASVGLSAGLAFATRYAFWPLCPVSLVCILIESVSWQPRLRRLAAYLAGWAAPVGLVLANNYLTSGAILLQPNASDQGLIHNLRLAIGAIFGKYLGLFDSEPSIGLALLGLLVLILGITLVVRRKTLTTLRAVLVDRQRYVLALWSLSYLAALIWQRSLLNFDWISPRLIAPAGIVMVVIWAALLAAALPVSTKMLASSALAVVTVLIGLAGWRAAQTQAVPLEQQIASSERLAWIAQNTTGHDLIVGDSAVDIPYYLGRTAAVSFSSYPYTDYPEYSRLMAFANRQCAEYEHIYLIIRTHYDREEAWQRAYGPFVTDLMSGRTSAYPDVKLVQRLSSAHIFELLCPAQPTRQ